jgi:UDP-N-acetylmuramate: L-alanyl-gamma-D-glutamyl-meso-diaminopimelate ligase
MHIHILGICGTFMGSLAILAKQLGFEVSGSDANVYPPMSTQLEEQGIRLCEGFDPKHLRPAPDMVIIGNAMSRGNPSVEYVLDRGIRYTSGPEWLAQNVLHGRWVLGVAGTHGKTTTSAMLAWILEYAGMKPGYLIGGVTNNLPASASLGDSIFFVVEADEYDSAFFDKRSKFIHYAPRTTILNNLEFDHADIFDDLEAIKRQFHHLVRTLPGNGLILSGDGEEALEDVLARGCWTPRQSFGVDSVAADSLALLENGGVYWDAELIRDDGSKFALAKMGVGGEPLAQVQIEWQMTGRHNVNNAVAAIAAAHHAGVEVFTAAEALNQFRGVKRRMELRGERRGIRVYDDFAHHPTAIETTLDGMAAKIEADRGGAAQRLVAVIEPASNTMRAGFHQDTLVAACHAADEVVWRRPSDSGLDFAALEANNPVPSCSFDDVDEIVGHLAKHSRSGDHIVIMSNGGFGGIHDKLLRALR